MTLRGRLTVAFLTVVLGPLLVGTITIGFAVRGVNGAFQSDRLASASGSAAGQLAGLCARARTAADLIAALPPAQREAAVRSAVARKLVDAAEWTPDRATGGALVAAGPAIGEATNCDGPTGAVPVPGDTTPVMVAAVELRRPDGAPAGQVRAAFELAPALLRQQADNAGAELTVLAGRRVIGSTLPADQASRMANPERAADQFATRVIKPSRGQPFTLVLSEESTQPRGFTGLLVVVVLGVILLAALVVWRLSRATTVPIREVADAAERVAAGDLAARVPVRGRDEVGQLASTFNRMTREMQAYVTALTVSRDQLRGNLALLGDTLSSAHDLDRILEVILETVLGATGAQAGVVLLTDRTGGWPGVLIGKAGQNLAGRTDGAPLRLAIGEGLLGGVAASGEPRRGRVMQEDQQLAAGEPRCQTYIAVPFSGSERAVPTGAQGLRSDRVLGVLALYDRLGADDFDDSDLVTLRTFAGQAGVAVENVLLHGETERMSLIDSETGLWNERYLGVSLDRELQRAVRFGRSMAVLNVDLDQLAAGAEDRGQSAEDALMVEVGSRLRGAVRDVDLAFRRSDGGFVLILPEVGLGGAREVASRVVAAVSGTPIAVAAPEDADGAGRRTTEVAATVSIGIATYPNHGTTSDDLMAAAGRALDDATAGGRNTWRVAAKRPRHADA